jgi:N-acylneuraminate cytidylyltransferase
MDPSVAAIIPARGGSKRIPQKNLQVLAGKPLIVHTIEHALAASLVEAVYVSTEDPEIARVSRKAGALVIERPASLADDQVSSEAALLHALEVIREARGDDPDVLVFLQCTSPIRRHDDIDNAVRMVTEGKADTVFSACKNSSLLWRHRDGAWHSLNYDYRNRQRDQDFPLEVRENGSIYALKPWVLRRFKNRLGGRIAVYEMDDWCSFQVDEPKDLKLCEWILQSGVITEGLRAFA